MQQKIIISKKRSPFPATTHRKNPKTTDKTRLCFQTFFIFSPTWGSDPIYWNIFHMGWFNHQLDVMFYSKTVRIFRKKIHAFPQFAHRVKVKDFVMMENVGRPETPKKHFFFWQHHEMSFPYFLTCFFLFLELNHQLLGTLDDTVIFLESVFFFF